MVEQMRHKNLIHFVETVKDLGEGVDWMHLAQDRDQWRASVNTIMKIQVL
jgi:hypothetical protein